VLFSVSSIVLISRISDIDTLGSHSDTHECISAAIRSSVSGVIPSYKSVYNREPNSGFKIRSPGLHVKILRNEFNIALTLIRLSTLYIDIFFNNSLILSIVGCGS
jgi:hypothetical protein